MAFLLLHAAETDLTCFSKENHRATALAPPPSVARRDERRYAADVWIAIAVLTHSFTAETSRRLVYSSAGNTLTINVQP